MRGHSLRVFTDFLQKHDPGLKANTSGHFAGLQRIGDPNDGTALWTTLTDPQLIKTALEARTREREAEARNGNAYIQRAVESLARQTTVIGKGEKAAEPEAARRAIKVEAAVEAPAETEAAGKAALQVVGTNDLQHQQITSQLSKIQDDLGQLSKIQDELSQLSRIFRTT